MPGVLNACKLAPNDVLNVYLIGSRVYGNIEDYSDWIDLAKIRSGIDLFHKDFVIVVNDGVHADPHIEVDDINAGVFQESKFFEFIHRHTFWMLTVLYLPKQFVWKEVKEFPLTLKKGRFRKEVVKYSTERWQAVERWYGRNDERRARKNIVHSIRGLMFGMQLLAEGTISQWDVANKYHFHLRGWCTCSYLLQPIILYEQVMAANISTWAECEVMFKPLFDEHLQNFNELFTKLQSQANNKKPR